MLYELTGDLGWGRPIIRLHTKLAKELDQLVADLSCTLEWATSREIQQCLARIGSQLIHLGLITQ